jgi:hypothetical protein
MRAGFGKSSRAPINKAFAGGIDPYQIDHTSFVCGGLELLYKK